MSSRSYAGTVIRHALHIDRCDDHRIPCTLLCRVHNLYRFLRGSECGVDRVHTVFEPIPGKAGSKPEPSIHNYFTLTVFIDNCHDADRVSRRTGQSMDEGHCYTRNDDLSNGIGKCVVCLTSQSRWYRYLFYASEFQRRNYTQIIRTVYKMLPSECAPLSFFDHTTGVVVKSKLYGSFCESTVRF